MLVEKLFEILATCSFGTAVIKSFFARTPALLLPSRFVLDRVVLFTPFALSSTRHVRPSSSWFEPWLSLHFPVLSFSPTSSYDCRLHRGLYVCTPPDDRQFVERAHSPLNYFNFRLLSTRLQGMLIVVLERPPMSNAPSFVEIRGIPLPFSSGPKLALSFFSQDELAFSGKSPILGLSPPDSPRQAGHLD